METGRNTTEERLHAIEARLEALEATPEVVHIDFWALDTLKHQAIPGGSVIFAGTTGTADYQWQRPVSYLQAEAWNDQLERLAALAHPVRGEMLRRLLAGPATAQQLVAEELASSSGTAYHHLTALSSAGWISKEPGGAFRLRPSRVVALLAIIAAAEDH